MNEIFGVPTTTIMFVLLGAFVVSMSIAIYVAIRYRVVFKLGLRNIPRRPAQTILIVVGLMLSTLIIAAAFTTGDTLNQSVKSEVYQILGETDERVLPDSGAEDPGPPTGAVMSESIVGLLEAELRDQSDIEGVMPLLSESVPVLNTRTQLSEPSIQLTGLDASRLDVFGGIESTSGDPIDLAGLGANGVVLNEAAAEKLDARVGDELLIYTQGLPHTVTVEELGRNSLYTGYNQPGSAGGMAVNLSTAQALFGYSDRISSVEVTNRGGVEDGVAYTESAMASLEVALADTPYRALAAKQNDVEAAETLANVFLTLFLIFGLFSIAVGILLIFLIFVMLAAERKSEMGMARAVGMKRRQLTEMFLTEGVAYDLVSALIGAALGVAVAFAIARFTASFVGDSFSITPTVTWQSLVIAYSLGVVMTFITIALSSWRISNLNIVRAIRDLPEPVVLREGRRWFVFGIVGMIVGVAAAWIGGAAGNAFAFMLGISLLPLSIAAALRTFGVAPRPLYSTAAFIVLVLWLLPETITKHIFPATTGNIEMFFLSGIVLVASATVLIVWNAPVITRLVGRVGGISSRWLPAVKTAVAYPLERKGRTGMTIAMFSLVIFSLVMMSTMMATANRLIFGSDSAAAGWDIQATQATTNAVDDIRETLSAAGADVDDIAGTARIASISAERTQIRLAGEDEWRIYQINGADDPFFLSSDLPLQTRAAEYADDQAVWDAMRADGRLVVIDNNALSQGGNLAPVEGQFRLEGVSPDDTTMSPVEVEVADPVTGVITTFYVVGVIDVKVVAFPGLLMTADAFTEAFSARGSTSFITHVIHVAEGADAEAVARVVETSLVEHGVQAITYSELLETWTRQSRAFLLLIESFMVLGLVVGVAALGVIAFRSVVERRQQIGMLRAIGFKRSMVAASFLIESSMITGIGILSGTILALVLSANLVSSGYAFGDDAEMVIPTGEIAIFLLIALIASLMMAWIPSRRAARVPVAEALRYE